MSIGIIIATVMFCFYLFQYISEKEKAKEEERSYESLMERSDKENHEEEKPMATKSLVKGVLKRIGCETEEDDGGLIRFNYQGENFIIQANESSPYIIISDVWWYSISTFSDLEEFARLQKVINAANRDGSYTIFYTISRDSDEIVVHTKRNDLFIPEIPNIEEYLVSLLDGFFRVQRFVHIELEKYKLAEEQL
jgi:hypothetical protein